MCICLELGSYQDAPVILGIEEHTCTNKASINLRIFSVDIGPVLGTT